jgi:hypothetical protein
MPKRSTSPRSVDSVYKDAHAQESSDEDVPSGSWREVYFWMGCTPDAHGAGW